jgi:hypothetical protein
MPADTVLSPEHPAARAIAARVHRHFVEHLEKGAIPRDATASVPDMKSILAMVEAGFWASLRREEKFTPKISLAYTPAGRVSWPIRFERAIPLASGPLTKLAPAVERPGIHLGVWPEEGELRVWGATRDVPAHTFVLEVFAPGVLVVKESRGEESGKFVNIAVLQGDEFKVIDERAATVPDCPALLTSLLGLETQFGSTDGMNVLIQLAVSIRKHGRGGTLLVTSSRSQNWRDSIVHPITYSVLPAFGALSELMEIAPHERPERRWQELLARVVDAIGGLTAVDGATIINEKYELLAFGAKIIRRPKSVPVEQLIVTEPVEGSAPSIADPSQLGGTRHLSAAQFVYDQRDAIALVASQDGRFTVFAWSPCENMVHAHRIDALLL